MSERGPFAAIVVPVDFAEAPEDENEVEGVVVDAGTNRIALSRATVDAVTMAAAMARSYGATLHLVHAVPQMQSAAMYQGPVAVPTMIIDEIHQRAVATSLAALEALASAHAAGIDVQYSAAPARALPYVLERAKTLDADLIVMAASGRSRVARFFVGSTADRIIRDSPCPVLIIPAHRDGA